jgi:hypothetical protein
LCLSNPHDPDRDDLTDRMSLQDAPQLTDGGGKVVVQA